MSISCDAMVRALHDAGVLVGTRGVLPESFSGVADDSRNVTARGLFIAVRGSLRDGHDFLDAARGAGASAALVEDPSRTDLPVIIVREGEGRNATALAAAAAYGWPTRQLRVVA